MDAELRDFLLPALCDGAGGGYRTAGLPGAVPDGGSDTGDDADGSVAGYYGAGLDGGDRVSVWDGAGALCGAEEGGREERRGGAAGGWIRDAAAGAGGVGG